MRKYMRLINAVAVLVTAFVAFWTYTEQALIEAVRALPLTRKACSCSSALKNARFT